MGCREAGAAATSTDRGGPRAGAAAGFWLRSATPLRHSLLVPVCHSGKRGASLHSPRSGGLAPTPWSQGARLGARERGRRRPSLPQPGPSHTGPGVSPGHLYKPLTAPTGALAGPAHSCGEAGLHACSPEPTGTKVQMEAPRGSGPAEDQPDPCSQPPGLGLWDSEPGFLPTPQSKLSPRAQRGSPKKQEPPAPDATRGPSPQQPGPAGPWVLRRPGPRVPGST